MKGDVRDQLKAIKQSFRFYMNGQTAQSMREKGVNYKVNWGIDLITLKKMAKEIGYNYELSINLWKENSRECKILATYIMPPKKLLIEVAEIWIDQVEIIEIGELLAFNLLRYTDYAKKLAFQTISTDDSIKQIIGYNILSGLFTDNMLTETKDINEFIDQAEVALCDSTLQVKQAVYRCFTRFSSMGKTYEKITKNVLSRFKLI